MQTSVKRKIQQRLEKSFWAFCSKVKFQDKLAAEECFGMGSVIGKKDSIIGMEPINYKTKLPFIAWPNRYGSAISPALCARHCPGPARRAGLGPGCPMLG